MLTVNAVMWLQVYDYSYFFLVELYLKVKKIKSNK